MSRGVKDRDYKPKSITAGSARSSRSKRKVEPVNYSEAEDDTYSDSSERTLIASESGFGSEIKLEIDRKKESQEWWTPKTLTRATAQLGQQLQHQGSIEMARESEGSAFEIMLELMIAMKQDDKAREGRRETEEREREAQREERQAELIRSSVKSCTASGPTADHDS